MRQGGTLSASLYKLYIHPLLEKLEKSTIGPSLGGAHIGTPTCADDMVFMANNEWDLQAMIDITELFAPQRRYTLHPTKSCVLYINQSGDDSLSQFYLCGKRMNTVDEMTHLGITRRNDRRLTHLVEERVKRGSSDCICPVWGRSSWQQRNRDGEIITNLPQLRLPGLHVWA